MQRADSDNCGRSRFESCKLSETVFQHLPYVSPCMISFLFKGGEVRKPAEVLPQSAGRIYLGYQREKKNLPFQQSEDMC